MRSITGAILSILTLTGTFCGQEWTKEVKDRDKRGSLHSGNQLVRGDSGQWSDEARVQHAPPIERKPGKMTLDAWADQLVKQKLTLTEKDDNWLIFRTEQLDDNDRFWVERIERRDRKFTVVAQQAKWQGKYFRNFTCYQVVALNLGKVEPGEYEVKWLTKPLSFTKVDGDGKALEGRWPKDERAIDKKPTELRLSFTVNKAGEVKIEPRNKSR